MTSRKQKRPYSNSPAPDPARPGLVDEVRALYTRQADYAARTIALSQEEGVNTEPAWLRVVNFIGVSLIIIAALTMLLGALRWPDAPIRQTPSGFIGKTGLAHTGEDYELFKVWERWLLVAFPLAFIVNIGAALVTRRKRKARCLKG